MAYTERYVTSGASGGGVGSSGDPWTLAEALAAAVAGDRVNIQSDAGYSLGADTVDGVGTYESLVSFRGYNSVIGDLEGLGRNSNGTLVTTNFPVITLTGTLTPNGWGLFESLVFTGALASYLVSTTTNNKVSFISCSFTNTQSDSSAGALRLNDHALLVNCDFECSGAVHPRVVDADVETRVLGCRIKGEDAAVSYLRTDGGSIIGTTIYHDGASTAGYGIEQGARNSITVINCTFYNLEKAILLVANSQQYQPLIVNNHVTDCDEYLDNAYSGTANAAVIEVQNRTRDNTTPRTGIGDGVNSGEITTDTGGAATDFTDAPGEDFSLIFAAPGKAAGIGTFTDCGALQREEAAAGGGMVVHPGTSGGARG